MMKDKNHSYKKVLNIPFADAVAKVKALLPSEGFGVLTEIDVKATLKKKLNIDFPNYLILGICNPAFAYKALQAEKDVGLVMPCNILVYEEAEKVAISAMRPAAALKTIDSPHLNSIAEEVEPKIKRIIDAL